MKWILVALLLALCAAPVVADDINVSVKSVGTTYIEWQWDAGYNLTDILIDGIQICGYETTDNTIIRSGLDPASLHSINVTNGTVYGENITMTLAAPPTTGALPDAGLGAPVSAGIIAGIAGALIITRRKQ